MSLIKAPYLEKGDKVMILSTARKVAFPELLPAIEILKSWGLEVAFAQRLFHEENQFAGTDKERTADLQQAINDPEIKAIICARGGYGTARIIDRVDFTPLIKNSKWLCGFSDVTVTHNHLHSRGLCSIHSTMPLLFAKAERETLESLRKALFGEELNYTCNTHEFNRPGLANGQIVGGNLSLLVSMIGTPSDIDTRGKILFIEDLDEYLYHIDRMMLQLKRSGKLENLAGLIVGDMSDMKDNTIPFGKTAYEIIRDTVAEYQYPVCFHFPVGHENHNVAMVCGGDAELSVGVEETSLKFV